MSKFGVMLPLRSDMDIREEFKKIRDIGCSCCQIAIWNMSRYNDENAEKLLSASKEFDIEISTLWAGWSGPRAWNFTEGPMTLGIVPPAYRMQRMEDLVRGIEFAAKLGVSRVATHAGFLPENMNDPQYFDIIAALRYLASECRKYNINFLFETGQETPITLLRFIEAIGMDNVGINMDTANLILYGKANSADAITVFGKYVMDTHIKDGLYPTNGLKLGREVKVGEGMANIPEVIRRLKEVGYTGNYIIEREISGEQQQKDITDTLAYLKTIL